MAEESTVGSLPVRKDQRFARGDFLVDPRHGVVVVDGVETRPHAGKPLAYLRLHAVNGLVILLPRDDLERVGLRPPMRPADTEAVFAALAGDPTPIPPWRQKEFIVLRRRVESGDPLQVAAVLRDLAAKEHAKGMGSSEKSLLEKATEILATELALVLQTGMEEANRRIAEALQARS